METTVSPSWWDACCRSSRREYDFNDKNNQKALSDADTLVLLKYNQVGILTILFLILLLVVTWMIFTVVPGFGRFDGAAGEASAVSHIGWWTGIELFVLVIGAMSIYFGIHYTTDGKLEKGVGRMRQFLNFYTFLLVIAILANIVHFILAIIEANNCTSTLCTSHKGFLVALIFILIIIALLEGWQIYRVYTYNKNVMVSLANEKGGEYELTMESRIMMNEATMKQRVISNSSFTTPLIKHVQKENKNNGRHGLKSK